MARFIFVVSLSLLALVTSCVAIYMSYSVGAELEAASYLLPASDSSISIRNDLYRNIFQIFLAVLTAVSALFAILGVGLYSSLRGALENRVSKALRDTVRTTQNHTQAWAFKEFGYIWSVIYDSRLQAHLSNSTPPLTKKEIDETIEFIESSLLAAKNGKDRLSRLGSVEKMGKSRRREAKKLKVDFDNLIVYGETAKFILNGKKDLDFIEDLEKMADDLYLKSIDKELIDSGFVWYFPHETVAFFKIHVGAGIGNQDMRNAGIKIASNLIKRKRLKYFIEPPPKNWADDTKNEYQKNGINLD